MVERVGEKHPDVCTDSTKLGPCTYRRVKGSTKCPMHGGQATERVEQRTQLKNFIITNFAAEAAKRHFGGELKCLTDEIVVLRTTLESIFNFCATPNDLILYSDKITGIANAIKNQVEVLQKIEERNKQLIDRQTLYLICDKIVEILVAKIEDRDLLKDVGEQISTYIMSNFGQD